MFELPELKRRWYDQNNKISVAVQLMKKFPIELQEIIFKGVSLLAEKDYEAKDLISNTKSLGSDKVMAIHKSKQKRRSYDSNQVIHKALSYLFLMSDDYQLLIAERILELLDLIQDYLRLCQQCHQDMETDHVETLTYTYVHRSPQAAKELLKKIEQEFIKRLDQLAKSPLSLQKDTAPDHVPDHFL